MLNIEGVQYVSKRRLDYEASMLAALSMNVSLTSSQIQRTTHQTSRDERETKDHSS